MPLEASDLQGFFSWVYNFVMLFDPENNETRALFDLYPDFGGKRVLEIGCGDGRLTWRYAERVASLIAIDPNADKLARAQASRPPGTQHVHFHNLDLEAFAARNGGTFDLAILSWSL